MPWSVVAPIAGSVVAGALGGSSGGSSAQQASDPFAPQRGQYQTALSSLMGGASAQGGSTGTIAQLASMLPALTTHNNNLAAQVPTAAGTVASLQSNPAYQFQLGQGVAALDRSAAAKGSLGSGQAAAELMQYGQGLASTNYQQLFTDQQQTFNDQQQIFANANTVFGNTATVANQQSANFGNQYQQLAALAGANVGSPAVAGQLQAQSTANLGATVGQAVNAFGNSSAGQSVSNWVSSLFGGSSPGTGVGAPSLSSADASQIYNLGYGD